MKNGIKAIKVQTETIVPFKFFLYTTYCYCGNHSWSTFWPHLLIFLLVTTSWFVKSLNGKWCPFDIVNLFHPFLPSVDGILFSTYASYTTCMYLHFSLSLVSLNSLFLYFMTPFLNRSVLISKFLFSHFRKS